NRLVRVGCCVPSTLGIAVPGDRCIQRPVWEHTLAPLGSQAQATQIYEEERDAFFRILLHDDRNSYYVLSSDESGAWTDTPLKRNQLPFQRFDSSSNYYITHNGFSDRRRKLESTRQVNALFYDLDCHGAGQFECRRLVAEAQRIIQGAVERGDLPQPTMVVDSGRGLHLYYVLERSIPYRLKAGDELKVNEKGLTFFQDVQKRLAAVLTELLAELEGIDVDQAVFDHTRVSRIPGTYNAKAGCRARLVGGPGPYCHLTELAAYRPASTPGRAPEPAPRPTGTVIRLNRLMMARLKKVAELQGHRGFACEGTRELMSFVYYNTAVQIYERAEARARLEAFNARFKQPLPCSELDGIRSSVDSVVNVKGESGYYVLNAETLVRLLGLTQQEMDELQFFSSKRAVERTEAKRKTRQRREERNARICALYAEGTLTQQQVADNVGCSVRTVCSVLKDAGLTHPRLTTSAAATTQSKHTAAQETRQSKLQALRQLIGHHTTLSAAPHSAISCHPCLWGSAQRDSGLFDDGLFASASPSRRLGELLSAYVRPLFATSSSPPDEQLALPLLC
ncbi:MAG: hypothetical protein ACI36W_07075, partial [Coriobacteriales bacterium]